MKETELAQYFIDHFEGFEIFKEVPAYGIIDIVLRSGQITTSIEVKCSLNFEVIEQAFNNINMANYSYIAVPKPKSKSFAYRICKEYGIGVLVLAKRNSNSRPEFYTIEELVKPRFNRKISKLELHDWQKESVAGSQNERMTAFKNSVRDIVQYVQRNKGKVHIKDVLKNVSTHYSSISSATQCIIRMVQG
jgi:hypothetical protein